MGLCYGAQGPWEPGTSVKKVKKSWGGSRFALGGGPGSFSCYGARESSPGPCVGETMNSIQKRFSSHRSSIRTGKSNQLIHGHFHNECHGLDNCRIIPIENIEAPGLNQKETTRHRL